MSGDKILFRFLDGDRQGDMVSFQQKHVRIGRADDVDLAFDGATFRVVSGHHAVVKWTGDCFEISDTHSTNGTWLNGRKIDSSELKSGDVIRFGTTGPEVGVIIPTDSVDQTVLDVEAMQLLAEAREEGREASLDEPRVSEDLKRLTHKRFVKKTMFVALGTGAGIAGFAWTLIEGLDLDHPDAYFRAVLCLIVGGILVTLVSAVYHGRPGRQRFKPLEMALIVLISITSLVGVYLSIN